MKRAGHQTRQSILDGDITPDVQAWASLHRTHQPRRQDWTPDDRDPDRFARDAVGFWIAVRGHDIYADTNNEPLLYGPFVSNQICTLAGRWFDVTYSNTVSRLVAGLDTTTLPKATAVGLVCVDADTRFHVTPWNPTALATIRRIHEHVAYDMPHRRRAQARRLFYELQARHPEAVDSGFAATYLANVPKGDLDDTTIIDHIELFWTDT